MKKVEVLLAASRNQVTVSYLVHYDTFLQNATDIITKCDSYFIYRMQQRFITKCYSYYKMRRFYYKMRQLLQNATFNTKCDGIDMYTKGK